MRTTSTGALRRSLNSASGVVSRAGCIALFACMGAGLIASLGACGGGGDVGVSPSSTAATAPASAPAPAAPTQSAVAPVTAESIDNGASGDPVMLRVARSANGDGFAVWLAYDGTRHNLWANRYRAATRAWGTAVSIETTAADIGNFDLSVDPDGNAVVVWGESRAVRSVRFTASAGVWAAAELRGTTSDPARPRVATDGSGAVIVVWTPSVVGRYFDPATGVWENAPIAQDTFGTGDSNSPVPILDGSGNALVVYRNERTSAGLLASNYYSRSTGNWGKLPPDVDGILGEIPGSGIGILFNDNVQLAATPGGNFLAAWQGWDDTTPNPYSVIRIARFTSSTRTWSTTETLLTGSYETVDFALQRIATDASGIAQLIWTERDGTRTALKAMRLDGAVCNAPEVLDRAIGGGAARADLAVDAAGHAIAIWQQFEGGRPDDGSRSNIAINRFDATASLWSGAVLAETQPGNAISPSASAGGGQALLGWIQSEGGTNRVKAALQSLGSTP